jgi:chromosomal replication initiator protein
VTKDDKEIVSALQDALADKVGKKRYDLWFGTSTHLSFDGKALRLGVPNQCFLDWIRGNFRRQIAEACEDVLGCCPAVDFHLVGGKAHSAHPEKKDLDREAGESQQRNKTIRQPHNDRRGEDNFVRQEEDPPRRVTQPMPETALLKVGSASLPALAAEQPALRIAAVSADETATSGSIAYAPAGGRKFSTLESFVAGQSNKLALTSAEIVIRQPGQITPLLIHGSTSVGKTHLLEGIWSAFRKRAREAAAVYLSAEQFTSHFLEALRGSGLPSFRRKYRGVGLLVLDDLQFLVGKRATQVELLHTIDTLMHERRQLVFAADRSPAELAELGPELTTRLASGMVCRIDPPDYATRRGIVGQLARRMKLPLPQEVQDYIASKLTNHARELSGALCRLRATSESLDRPITLALAEEALGEMIHHSSRVVRLGDIEKAVCDVFGLDPASLQANDKSTRVSHPRMLAMWLARKHTRAALSEIGHYFGRRSHSTVVSAQKRVDCWMSSGQPLHLAERTWEVDEAIRQVERHLAAG